MRRFALGCGAFLIVLIVAGAWAATWATGTSVPGLFGTYRALQGLDGLRDDPRLQRAYDPPSDGLLAEAQIERWLSVQRAMDAELTPRFRALADRHDAAQDGPLVWIRSTVDVAGAVAAAGRTHADALHDADFSLAEYDWVRDRILEAAGLSVRSADVAAFLEAGADADAIATRDAERTDDAPPGNVERLRPYRDDVRDNLTFAWYRL
ncbi:MAG: hypothetical protein WD336_05300 [Trueperaceae bacterium]